MNETKRRRPEALTPFAAEPAENAAPTISSEELMAGRKEVIILHGNNIYRLKITASDKLILTK